MLAEFEVNGRAQLKHSALFAPSGAMSNKDQFGRERVVTSWCMVQWHRKNRVATDEPVRRNSMAN